MNKKLKNTPISEDMRIEDFYHEVTQENKRTTARQYSWQVYWYCRWLYDKYQMLPSEVVMPEKKVNEYLKYMVEEFGKFRTKQSVRVSKYALRKLYYKILKVDFRTDRVTEWGELSTFEPVILERPEVEEIFFRAQDRYEWDKEVMLRLGWHCALRTSEVTGIKGKHILQDEPKIRCPISKGRKGRNSFKTIQLPENLYADLQRLSKGDKGRLISWSKGQWSSAFSSFARDVLTRKDSVRWHDFARHTRLTHYAEDTENFLKVLMLSGHQSPEVARQYFERAEIDITEDIEQLGVPWYDRL